jgi:hypothetical protein
MNTLELVVYQTEDGEVRFKLPEGVTLDQLRIRVEIAESNLPSSNEIDWTEAEIAEMLAFKPVPAEQIVTGGWEDLNITDSQAWVEKIRQQNRSKRRW